MEIYTHGHENTISVPSVKMEKWAKKPGKRSSIIKKGEGKKRICCIHLAKV
jgi:hypothetical protein